jgi:hypothetical protein
MRLALLIYSTLLKSEHSAKKLVKKLWRSAGKLTKSVDALLKLSVAPLSAFMLPH